MTRTRLIAAIVWAASALLLSPLTAKAQARDLRPEIIESPSLNAEQRREIRTWIDENLRLLEADDAVQMRRGKEGLLEPLINPRATVSFRLEYSEALAPALGKLAAGENERRAINALIVAGGLGTTQGANLLDSFAADKRSAVRYAAARGLRRTFVAVKDATPAMARQDAERIVDRLGQLFSAEQSPEVVDALTRALISATEITRGDFAPVRAKALEVLARVCRDRIRSLPLNAGADAFLAPMVRAGGTLRDAAANVAQVNLPQAETRLILEFGADLWAHLVRRIEAGELPTIRPDDAPDVAEGKRASRALAIQIVQIGQATMFFAGSRLGQGQPFDPKQPAEWIGQATGEGDSQFTRRARELIGSGGILSKAPFNYPPDRFLSR